jgi:RNA polymerase sigma-70 factor (ECF subfamily)
MVSRKNVDEAERRRLFDEVFLPHLAQAFRLARWLAGNSADAEDIVQEASLRAFRGIQNFGGISARAWSLTITRNTAYSWLLKNRPAAVVFAEDLGREEKERLEQPEARGAAELTPETALLSRADAEEVRAEIAALPAPFKEVIVLRELNDLSYREIAEITGSPLGTVMSRLARAREMLMHRLGRAS